MSQTPTQDQLQALWSVCTGFISKQEITCAETIAQTDHVIINAYGFIEEVCDVVGYAPSDDADEEDF